MPDQYSYSWLHLLQIGITEFSCLNQSKLFENPLFCNVVHYLVLMYYCKIQIINYLCIIFK